MNTHLFVYFSNSIESNECRQVVAALVKRFGADHITVMGANDDLPLCGTRSAVIVLQSSRQPSLAASSEGTAAGLAGLRKLLASAIEHDCLVMPVVVSGTPLADTSNLPPELTYLSSQQNFTIREGQHFSGDVRRLCQHIEAQLGRPVYAWLLWPAVLAFPVAIALALIGIVALLPITGSFVLLETTVECLLLCLPFSIVSLIAAAHAASQVRIGWFLAFMATTILAVIVALACGILLDLMIEEGSLDLTAFLVIGLLSVWSGQLALLVPYSIGKRRLAFFIARRGDESLPAPIPNIAFISYRRSDTRGMCDRIFVYLSRRFRYGRIFRDVNSILVGAQFEIVLHRALTGSRMVLVLIGPTWLSTRDSRGVRRLDDPDDFVRQEIRTALKLHKPVIPVLIGGATMPSKLELPSDIASLVDSSPVIVRDGHTFNHDMQFIVRSIRKRATPFPTLNYLPWIYMALLVAMALYGLFRLNEITTFVTNSLNYCVGWLCGAQEDEGSIVFIVISFVLLRAIVLTLFGATIASTIRARRFERLFIQSAPVLLGLIATICLVWSPDTGNSTLNFVAIIGAVMALLIADGVTLMGFAQVQAGASSIRGRTRIRLLSDSQVFEDPFTRIKVLIDQHRYDEALTACDVAIGLNPTRAATYAAKGGALVLLERYEEALAFFDTAIRLDPLQALAYRAKASVLFSLERYEEALSACNEAIRLDPTDSLVFQVKGLALAGLNRHEEALDAYDEAIRLDPMDEDNRAYRDETLHMLNRL